MFTRLRHSRRHPLARGDGRGRNRRTGGRHRHQFMRTTRRQRWFTRASRHPGRLRRHRPRRGVWPLRRTWHRVRRVRRRLDGRLQRLGRWQTHRAAIERRIDLGQIPGDAFEAFGQITACPGDVSQRTATTPESAKPTGRSPAGALYRASSVRRGLGATCGCPAGFGRTTGLSSSGNN